MKKIFVNLFALGLGAALLVPLGDAQAQGRERGWDRDRSGWDRGRDHRRDDDRGAKHWAGRERGRDWRGNLRSDRGRWDNHRRWDDRHDRYEHRRFRAPARYLPPRGYYSHRWAVGHRLPSTYYARPYYVDYRAYGLAPPPRGHHWVRVDNDVFLVALTSGLIANAIHDLFYY